MRRRLFWWFLAIVALMLAALGSAYSAPNERTPVVSYLVNAGADSDAWVPDDQSYLFYVQPHSWQWHLFDPESKRDTVFLRLSSFPLMIRWDPQFKSVEFIEGRRVERFPWALSGKRETVTTLPVDSAYCDFWRDATGRLWLDAGGPETTVRRWEKKQSGTWRVVSVDSPAAEICISEKLGPREPRPPTVSVTTLLYSMLIGNYKDSTLTASDTLNAWVASALDPSIGLEMGTGFGDSYHAEEPVVWVDRKRSRSKTVYVTGQSHDSVSGQIAFGERRGFMLIGSEYEGGYPVVVNMRSGQVILRVDRPSSRAVWVPAPQGWPH